MLRFCPLLHYIAVNNSLNCLCLFFRQDSVGLSYSEVEHLISSLDEITDYLTQHLADLDNEVIMKIKKNTSITVACVNVYLYLYNAIRYTVYQMPPPPLPRKGG